MNRRDFMRGLGLAPLVLLSIPLAKATFTGGEISPVLTRAGSFLAFDMKGDLVAVHGDALGYLSRGVLDDATPAAARRALGLS